MEQKRKSMVKIPNKPSQTNDSNKNNNKNKLQK
jgi:hypothetical protein